MLFGHNLHAIAPFEAFLTAFCTEFCRASFVVSCPRAEFWTPDQIPGFSGRHFGPGTILGSKKKWFCERSIFWWGGREKSYIKKFPMVLGIHMVVLLCQKPLFFEVFLAISIFPENWKSSPSLFPWASPISLRASPIRLRGPYSPKEGTPGKSLFS